MTPEPSTQPSADAAPGLRRELRLMDAVAVGLGAIIGAGIFVVTGVAAGVAGPAFLLGLLLAGIAATCNALSSAQLAATYPQAGGTYEYGYRVLHPWLGFAAGWMFLVSKLAAGGTVAVGFGSYFAQLLPGVPPKIAAVVATALLTIANLYGIKKAGRLNTGIVAVTLLVLVGFVLAGIPRFNTANLHPFAPFGVRGILESAALLFFAYTGYARIATLGEEVHEPRKTIPKAITIALASSILLYGAVALVAAGAIGAPGLAASRAPLERAAATFGLPGMRWVVAVGAGTAMLGVLLSQILGISRMLFAMARRGDLPAVLSRVHAKYGVPTHGVCLSGVVIVAVALFGTLEWVVAAAAFTILLYYSITNVAALRLGRADKLFPDWIPMLGLVGCVVLAVSLKPITAATGLSILGAGYLFRCLFRALTRTRSRA